MRPAGRATPATRGARPRWNEVLRALREARGVTQEGWAARLGVSRATVQRWERGTRAPDPGAEAAIVDYCRQAGLLRTFERGPLAGLALTSERLRELCAEARWPAGGARGVSPDRPTAALPGGSPVDRQPDTPHRDRHDGAPAVPCNLPAPLTSFVGRERELAEVRRVQAGTRLLTLTGAGGGGKTRLALALAAELLWAYPHGIWLVELASLADPALVSRTVATALGLRPAGVRPPAEAVEEFLRGRHLLLLLDNCEHLMPACAHLAEALLRACPHLEVLATSREPLGIAGEVVWRVPPMALAPPGAQSGGSPPVEAADAVRLFVERARLQQPDFALTPGNAAAVATICERLDGLPLAIELAAARVGVLSVAQIEARLHDRFRLLTSGSRTALPRHQTLRAALDWSHDLLTAPEQTLLRRLAVFAGGFTLDAAEAVCGGQLASHAVGGPGSRSLTPPEGDGEPPAATCPPPTEEVLDPLAQLVDKSLVIAEDHESAVRYRVLETVRQYAGDQLHAAGEVALVRDRHRDWCLALVQGAEAAYGGPREPAWLARLEHEHDNLRAALGWSVARVPAAALRLAAALARFWTLRGHVHEGRQWLAQALAAGAAGAPVPPEVRAKALDGAGLLAERQGDFAAARAYHERSVCLHRRVGDEPGVARAQGALGRCLLRLGDYADARALFDASLALHRRLGQRRGIASMQGTLGVLALRQGDLATARAHIESRLAISRELGDRDAIADALDDLATLAREQGDAARQVALLEESLALQRELGNRDGVALALGGLGMAAWAQGKHERAWRLLHESLALYREVGDRKGIALMLGYQSTVALYGGDHARAAVLSRECVARYREVGDVWAIGRYLPVLAAATFGLGQPERAARLCGAAAALRARLGTPLPRFARPAHDRTLADLRRALGESAFAAAWTAGETMPLEEAAAEALASPAPA